MHHPYWYHYAQNWVRIVTITSQGIQVNLRSTRKAC
jgi:hypothetical protein